MLVRLVVTGDLERSALGPSLERALRSAGCDVSMEVLHKLNELTTTPLVDPSAPGTRTPTPVRAMDLLGIENPLGPGETHACTYPVATVRRATLALRNA